MWISAEKMPVDKFANMEEKLWILEDLNMMYIRQIALSLQVKACFNSPLVSASLNAFLLLFSGCFYGFSHNLKAVGCVSGRNACVIMSLTHLLYFS